MRGILLGVRPIILACVLVASTGLHAVAMENHTDVLRDQYGNAIGGATVTVYLAGTTTLAAIYTDNSQTVKSNPFLTDALTGRYNFYAANGTYDIAFYYPGAEFDSTHTQYIALYDPADAVAGGGGGGVTGWPTVSTTKEVTWADNFTNALRIGGTTDKWAFYYDPTDGLQAAGVCGGVLNACNYTRKLQSGKYMEWLNSANASISRITESTGAWTNMKVDAEGTGNSITLPFRWDLDFCGVSPADGTTASHIWNRDPLSSVPSLTVKVGSNRGTCVLTFPDSDGTYGVQITKQIPDGAFTGSFDADIWYDTTGTGNARFQIATACYADDEADDASFNTASIVTAAAGTSGRPNKVTLTGITTTGCAAGELMRIRFFRSRTEASDTVTASVNVEKIIFKGRNIE